MARRANGEGSIRENKARGRWEARVTVGYDDLGKQIRRLVTAPTKAEAARKLRALSDEAESGIDRQRVTTTVSTFLAKWLDEAVAGAVAPSTEAQYRQVVRIYITPRIGAKRVRTLQPADVTAMLRDMTEPAPGLPDGYSKTARRLARTVLGMALRWGEQNSYVTRNVARIAAAPKSTKAERAAKRTMTPEQARAFLEHVHGDRLEALYVVGLSVGLRISELLGLAWEDVDLDADVPALRVRRSLKRLSTGKGKRGRGQVRTGEGAGLVLGDVKTNTSRRTIHLPAVTVAALRDHRRRQLAEQLAFPGTWPDRPLGADLVFRSPAGTALDPSNVAHALSKATTGAGIGHWTAHELRHSAASLLLALGVPLLVVSRTLGHSSITVTSDVYSHLLDAARSEAAAAMDRALGGV